MMKIDLDIMVSISQFANKMLSSLFAIYLAAKAGLNWFFPERVVLISSPFYSDDKWNMLVGDESSFRIRKFATFSDAKTEFEAARCTAGLGLGCVDRVVEITALGEGAQAEDYVVSMWRRNIVGGC